MIQQHVLILDRGENILTVPERSWNAYLQGSVFQLRPIKVVELHQVWNIEWSLDTGNVLSA